MPSIPQQPFLGWVRGCDRVKKPFLPSAVLCMLALLIVVGVFLTQFRGSHGSVPSVHQGSILLGGNEIMVIEGPWFAEARDGLHDLEARAMEWKDLSVLELDDADISFPVTGQEHGTLLLHDGKYSGHVEAVELLRVLECVEGILPLP